MRLKPAAGDRVPPWLRASVGAQATLLVGMGLGRFSYTPMVPALVEAGAVTPSEAGYIGAANLGGYLVGGLAVPWLRARADTRTILRASLVLSAALLAAVVLGEPNQDWRDIDLAAVTGRMTINGNTIGEGAGSLIMGHPFEALAWLANRVGDFGRHLKAGEFVTLGSVVATRWIQRCDRVTVDVDGLGSVGIEFD